MKPCSASGSRTITRRSSWERFSSPSSCSTCVSRASGAGRCARWARCWESFRAGRFWAWRRTSRSLQRLQSLPAGLPGRRRSAAKSEVAQSGMPPLLQLRGRVSCSAGLQPGIGERRPPDQVGTSPGGATSGKESGISFKFFPATPTTVDTPNLQRRRALAGVAAGAALLPILRSGPGLAAAKDPRLIRPPGALDERSFLERCIRCGECMKVCPNNALQPALLEAGVEGLWTPVLAPRIGYCEPSCVLCGEVCPTGAIWEITQAEKAWLPASAAEGRQTHPSRHGISTTAGAACPGRWPRNASCARSGAPRPRRPSTCVPSR
jgi:ferredoxin